MDRQRPSCQKTKNKNRNSRKQCSSCGLPVVVGGEMPGWALCPAGQQSPIICAGRRVRELKEAFFKAAETRKTPQRPDLGHIKDAKILFQEFQNSHTLIPGLIAQLASLDQWVEEGLISFLSKLNGYSVSPVYPCIITSTAIYFAGSCWFSQHVRERLKLHEAFIQQMGWEEKTVLKQKRIELLLTVRLKNHIIKDNFSMPLFLLLRVLCN